jgi:hypothetical protein
VLFSDFLLASGQSIAAPIDPAQIQVTPGGLSFAPTLTLTFNVTATAGQVLESFFHYSAISDPFQGALISLGSPRVTEDAAVTGVLDVCVNGRFSAGEPLGCPGVAGTAIAFATTADSLLSDRLNTQASSFFDIFVDITIDGGLSGTASLQSASVTVLTPEPSALFVLALPLAGLGALGLRREPHQHWPYQV